MANQRHGFVEFSLGAAATSSAVLFTNPIEVVKTRLQLQGELSSSAEKQYKGILHALRVIFQNEGIRGIQKGIVPGVWYQVFMNGSRLGSYGPIKRILNAEPELPFFTLKNILAGSLAGTLGATIGSPVYLIKVRIQAKSHAIAVGHQHNLTGMIDGLKSIWKEEGWKGLFRGVNGAIPRVATGSAAQLSSYDFFKHSIKTSSVPFVSEGVLLHLTSSLMASVITVTAMNPFDVVSTRLYNQKVIAGKGVLYTSVADCFIQTVRTEGMVGLYKGWLANLGRLCPHTVLTFLFWEQFKQIADRFGY